MDAWKCMHKLGEFVSSLNVQPKLTAKHQEDCQCCSVVEAWELQRLLAVPQVKVLPQALASSCSFTLTEERRLL